MFTLNAANIFNTIQGGSVLSILSSMLKVNYEIEATDGSLSLEFDGMLSINPQMSANVINAPVENGKYQSINKVKEPSRLTCVILINGLTGLTGTIPNIFAGSVISQNDTLKKIQQMIESTKTYTITTPKGIFESYDLVGWDYSVTANGGVSLLKVNLEFLEIMQVMEVSLTSTKSQKDANVSANSPVPKTPSESDLINGNKALEKAWKSSDISNLSDEGWVPL
ncbi:phage baseplate protein [Providencia rettgeri]